MLFKLPHLLCYSSQNWLRHSPVANLVWEARARGLQKVNLPLENGHYWAYKQNCGQSVLKIHLKSSTVFIINETHAFVIWMFLL